MSVKIHPSQYKDRRAMSVESDQIVAQFLPASGSKMCSLVHRPRRLELLVQRPEPRYRVAAYDGDYVAAGECSGFDEMFPTIDRCFCEGYPWRGTPTRITAKCGASSGTAQQKARDAGC